MNDRYVPGYFGKFPERGDFVQKRLPRSFLDPWDSWLQSAIFSSREQLGQEWLDYYLGSPVWRFVIAGGLCGEYPWCGVLMPSVDEVGRYFPLTLACPLPLDANPFFIATEGESWFAEAEAIVLSVLDEGAFNMQAFDERVLCLRGVEVLAARSVVSCAAGFGSAWRLALEPGTDMRQALPALSHQLTLQRLGPYSLWWGAGGERVAPSMLVCDALPVPADFAAMLSGDWDGSGWDDWSGNVIVE